MQVIVFGATGQVGTQLVKQALWRGHSVKAYGRNVYEMDVENDKLEKIKAGLFDAGDVLKDDSVVVEVELKKDASVRRSITIWIKKKDEQLNAPVNDSLLQQINNKQKSKTTKKKRNG